MFNFTSHSKRENILRMFDNRALRRKFRPKRQEVIGEWRKLHDEVINICSSQNINTVVISRRIGCMGNVPRIGR
jgi:hypothetical protein